MNYTEYPVLIERLLLGILIDLLLLKLAYIALSGRERNINPISTGLNFPVTSRPGKLQLTEKKVTNNCLPAMDEEVSRFCQPPSCSELCSNKIIVFLLNIGA